MFLDGEAGKEFALIKGHKGFVRRAMAHGVPLVPVYGKDGVDVTGGRDGGGGISCLLSVKMELVLVLSLIHI